MIDAELACFRSLARGAVPELPNQATELSRSADDADRDEDESDQLKSRADDLEHVPAPAHGDEVLGSRRLPDPAGAEIDARRSDDS